MKAKNLLGLPSTIIAGKAVNYDLFRRPTRMIALLMTLTLSACSNNYECPFQDKTSPCLSEIQVYERSLKDQNMKQASLTHTLWVSSHTTPDGVFISSQKTYWQDPDTTKDHLAQGSRQEEK